MEGSESFVFKTSPRFYLWGQWVGLVSLPLNRVFLSHSVYIVREEGREGGGEGGRDGWRGAGMQGRNQGGFPVARNLFIY